MATQQQIDKVRAYAFYPTQQKVSDAIIEANIEKWEAVISPDVVNREGIILYNATLDTLRYLVYTDPSESAGYRLREKVNKVEREVETQSNYVGKWEKILEDYLNGTLIIPEYSVSGKKVFVGGVSAEEINRVNNDIDSVNGLGRYTGINSRVSSNTRERVFRRMANKYESF
jgi:hypothetical protein